LSAFDSDSKKRNLIGMDDDLPDDYNDDDMGEDDY
jgi:hypothetical protein